MKKLATTTEVKNVSELNLSMFTDKLKNVELKEVKEKENLYVYPDHLKGDLKNSKEGKTFRRKLRTSIEKVCTDVLLHTKYARTEDLKNAVKSFNEIYKLNYRINNYKLESLSHSADIKTQNLIIAALEIIVHVNASK